MFGPLGNMFGGGFPGDNDGDDDGLDVEEFKEKLKSVPMAQLLSDGMEHMGWACQYSGDDDGELMVAVAMNRYLNPDENPEPDTVFYYYKRLNNSKV
jgi:hypothetical protein